MPSPVLRDQLRRLQWENEELKKSLTEAAIQEAIAKTAAWYLFDVISAHKLDKYVAAAVEQWPFLITETQKFDH